MAETAIIDCCLSTTVLPNFNISEFENRLDACLKTNSKILSLRLSTACPSIQQKFVQFSYDSLIEQIINCISKYNIKIKFDCPIPLWEIRPETKRILRMKGVDFNSLSSCYCNPPFDILWNGDIIWCSSCNNITTNYKIIDLNLSTIESFVSILDCLNVISIVLTLLVETLDDF